VLLKVTKVSFWTPVELLVQWADDCRLIYLYFGRADSRNERRCLGIERAKIMVVNRYSGALVVVSDAKSAGRKRAGNCS
jgi:hypothetical protein